MNALQVTIFIPAYNEAGSIKEVVKEAEEVLTKGGFAGEILVVDDGSTDGTTEILEELSQTVPNLRIILHTVNQGIAAAMMSGYKSARGEWIFFNSADAQVSMSYLLEFITQSKHKDIIVGYFEHRQDGPVRYFFSRIYHMIVGYLFGIHLRNINALKLFRREIFNPHQEWSGSLCVDLELLLHAMDRGDRIGEVLVEHTAREFGYTKVIGLSKTIHTFYHLLRLAMKRHLSRNERQPGKCPVSGDDATGNCLSNSTLPVEHSDRHLD